MFDYIITQKNTTMEKIYNTSKILAYVLAVISLLSIYSILYNNVFVNFSTLYKYSKTFNANIAMEVLSEIEILLNYIRSVCLYGGMFFFFFLLYKTMTKGSRLAWTITLGQVAAVILLCIDMFSFTSALFLYSSIFNTCYMLLNTFCIIGNVALLVIFGSMFRFFPLKSVQRYACIAVIVMTILFSIFTIITGSILTVITGSRSVMIDVIIYFLYPFSFAFFYFEFSKLKK